MAGLQPSGPEYGDVGALRQLGVKMSPETQTPTFFNPKGGRPKGPTPVGFGPAAALGGAGNSTGTPPAEEFQVPAEHQSLVARATRLAAASRGWTALAATPAAQGDERIQRIALAVKQAAKMAVLQARDGTPFYRGS
jgi:hypothetical protein